MKKQGFFITFEGGEGSGKSTHADLLKDYLQKRGFEVVLLREPGGTGTGEKLREILLSKSNNISPITELLLFLASRRELVKEVILPSLEDGKIVICDRFMDSTTAYQGYGRGIDLKLVLKLNKLAVEEAYPTLTFVLDTDNLLGFKLKGDDRIEIEDNSFHRKVRKGYLEIAKKEPQRVKIIKSKGEIPEIQEQIRTLIDKYLKKNF